MMNFYKAKGDLFWESERAASAPVESQSPGSLEVKNCNNCKLLEWGYGDVNDPEGWMCNGRDYKNSLQEAEHLSKLDDSSYRARPKKCCDPRKPTMEANDLHHLRETSEGECYE
jgi:hypothetical protein